MGEGAATQPEVIAASNVVLRVKPQVSISLHSYGKWIIQVLLQHVFGFFRPTHPPKYLSLQVIYIFPSVYSLSNLKAICRTKVADVLGIHDAAGYR
jgi:hypothetical protein